MIRRNRVLVVVAVCALGLTACGTRLPHSRITAANAAQVVVTPSAAGSNGGAVVPAGAATAPNGAALGTVSGSALPNAPGGSTANVVGNPGAAGTGTHRQQGSGGGSGQHNGGPAVVAQGGNGVVTASCPSTGSGTIKLGNVGPYSATGAGATAGPGRDILSVWAAYVNATGGICGHQVQVLTRDDQGSAAQRSALIKDLVENQHVAAIVGDLNSLTLSAEQNYIDSKHIPVIGGDLTTGVWYKDPNYFPQGSQDNEMLYRGYKQAQSFPNGNKVAFLYCAEVVTCEDSYRQQVANQIPEKAGSKFVYSKKVSITQISFAAECQAAHNAGAGAILPGGDASFVERVANSCAQQGLHFAYIADGLSVGDSQKDNKNLDGNLIVPTQMQPWMADNTPGARLFGEVLAHYGPGVEKSGGAMSNWVAALVAQQALTLLGGTPATPASVFDALHKIKNFTAGGLTAPLTYHSGPQASSQCTGVATVKNGQFVALNGGSLICRSGAALPLPT